MNRAKIFLIALYIVLLLIPGITVINNIGGLQNLSFYNSTKSLIYLSLQIFGLYAIVLLFVQVMVGAFMIPLRRVFGGQFLKLHITQGIFIYCLIVLHPALYIIFLTQTTELDKALGAILPIISQEELSLTLGKFAFLLLTVAVFTGLFRTHPFLSKHWRKFHILNYVSFALVIAHSYLVGQDTKSMPFVLLYPVFILGLLSAFFYRRIIRN